MSNKNDAPGSGPMVRMDEPEETSTMLFDAVAAWKDESLAFNEMKAKYKQSYASAYAEQSGTEAGKKAMAEAIVANEKRHMKDQQTVTDAAYFNIQVHFIMAGKQFVGPAFI